MPRFRHKPDLRHLVGGAVYELLFPVAQILSSEALEELTVALTAGSSELHRLESPSSAYILSSTDGTLTLEIRASGFSLQTSDYQGLEGLVHLQRLADIALAAIDQSTYDRVLLKYSGTFPIERRKAKKLFAERVIELLSDPSEDFTQEVSGTWDLGRYRLHYGIQPLNKKTFYLSHASVSAENVAARELGKVFGELDREGLRLLSWPLESRAIGILNVLRDEAVYHVDRVTVVTENLQSYYSFGTAEAEANRERIELLGRKHGAEEFSTEDELRLGALTERVRDLLPWVTKKDWRSVEDVHARLEEIEERTSRVRARYGLNG